MSGNNLQVLRAAVKRTLREACFARSRTSASAVALMVLSAATLMPQARAGSYTAATEQELRDAFAAASADGDASATITLTANISMGTGALTGSGKTKPIAINTNGFTLSGRSSPDASTQPSPISAATTHVIVEGAVRGGDAFPSVNMFGAVGLSTTNSDATNNGSITGGTGGTGAGSSGGSGAVMPGGTLINNGTITGGQGGVVDASNSASAGTGVVANGSAVTVVNNGTIRGGSSTGSGLGGIGLSAIGGALTLTNTGTIQGGSNPTASGVASARVGINVGTTPFVANATIDNSGTIEGGVGARAINVLTNASSLTLINSGTIRAGAGQSTAVEFSSNASATSVLELRPGSVIEGNVRASSSNVNDTFRLGGTGADTLDVSGIGSKYSGFAVYEKTGTSTWTLTGTAATVVPWKLLGGTLSVSSTGNLGSASGVGLTFDGGSLRNTASLSVNRNTTLDAGGGTFQTDADLLWTGNITGPGALTKTGSGTLTLTGGTISYGGGTTIAAGTLQIGNGGTLGSLPGNITNDGNLAFNRMPHPFSGGPLTVSGVISGPGTVTQLTGTTILTGNNTYAGATNLNTGTLRINGDQSAATGLVSVANGATLGGSGIIGGSVNVADGGHLAPGNSPGTLTMGTLTLSGGSILDLELGEANAVGSTLNDLINVNGDLTLDGTLNVSLSAGGTYGAGIYRLINYTGTLTDNGLDLGLMPASSSNYVQTSVANQVNLINTQGLVLNYWDSAPNARNDGQIGGGAGIWQAGGNDNWATADGAINADYRDGAMAIFGGTAGTVTVEDSLGAINVSGLQFAANGYRLEGDAIGLGAGFNTVRVGDGTDAGAAYIATITSALTGSGTLDKTDLGTLVLTGANDYSGGTTISGGTLQLGDGGTLGSLSGDVTNNGTLAFNRSDALGFDGVISGTGVVRQSGTGTTTLTGAGSSINTLNIERGTLEIANGASVAAISTTLAAGTTLRSGGTFTGTAGDNTMTLAGTLIGHVDLLDGNDQVQIALGADFSQASFDGGAGVDTLDLSYGGALTLPLTLGAGFEHFVKHGGGTLTLAGTVDSFSDSITVNGGSVQLSAANVVTNELRIESGVTVTGTGSLSGSFRNAGVLSPGNSPGTIHVAGNYTQDASGTLISEITPSGTDLLDIAGSATLAGTHQIQVEYGLYLDGTTRTLIQADGGISGDFDSVQINPSALMAAERQLSVNALSVSFTREAFTTMADPGTGRGRYAEWLEEQIDSGNVSGNLLAYIDTLLQQPTAEGVSALLRQQSEPVAAISQNSVSILGAGFARTVFDRFTVGDTAQCTPANSASDAINCAWAHGLRQWGDADGDAFGSAYDWTAEGGQIGLDRTLSSTWAVGATFGYADSDIRDVNDGRNELRSRLGGLYANYAAGPLNVGAVVFYSGNENRTSRNVTIGTVTLRARAEFDTDSYGVGARLGYRLTSEAGPLPLVRPFIEAFYDRTEGSRISERDAGAGNLTAHVHDRDGLRSTLGLQLAESFEGYGHVFRPALELGIVRQFGDVRSTLDLQPGGSTSVFRTHGSELDRTAYIGRASLDVSLGPNAIFSLGYGGELADSYSQHEGNLSFRIAW